MQEIELSESEATIPRAIPFGKFKILHQTPSNSTPTATPSNTTSSKRRPHARESPFTSHLRGLRLCPLLPSPPIASISTFASSSACASVSAPASIIVFAFRLCFRAPVFAFALRPLCFHLRFRACSSPSAAAASPRFAGSTPQETLIRIRVQKPSSLAHPEGFRPGPLAVRDSASSTPENRSIARHFANFVSLSSKSTRNLTGLHLEHTPESYPGLAPAFFQFKGIFRML